MILLVEHTTYKVRVRVSIRGQARRLNRNKVSSIICFTFKCVTCLTFAFVGLCVPFFTMNDP